MQTDIFDNRLIFGDNLLALKALEQEFAGRIKCIYIDPPFNTGGAFEYYDDGVEHSIWLSLMAQRLEILQRLLSEDGAIVVNLDDSEAAYCKVLLDGIFGRNNYITTIVVEAATGSSFKSVNIGPLDVAQYLLFYAKDKRKFTYQQQYIVKEAVDLQHFSRFIENHEGPCEEWNFVSINDHILQELGYTEGSVQLRWRRIKSDLGEHAKKLVEEKATEFALKNAYRVFETKTLQKPSPYLRKILEESRKVDRPIHVPREEHEDLFIYKGRQIYFLENSTREVDGVKGTVLPLSTIWSDIPTNNLQNEGSVHFPAGKKPEALLRRIFSMTTLPSDLVLDSFAGSGTTGAVAHKMGRRWIMVELGEHCHSHIIPRLRKVIDGEDPGGITQAVDWKGGGGFRYYRLAPSLLERDKWGNWVVNPEYNAAMLAEALCKLEGFTYAPSETVWWQQGYSTESDFIYVTTQNLSAEQLQALSEEVGGTPSPIANGCFSATLPLAPLPLAGEGSEKPLSPGGERGWGEGRTLLVLCSAFRGVSAAKAAERWPNLTIKKIPKVVLSRCEWGHDDYSLNVQNLPMAEPEITAEPKQKKQKKAAPGQSDLFGEGE